LHHLDVGSGNSIEDTIHPVPNHHHVLHNAKAHATCCSTCHMLQYIQQGSASWHLTSSSDTMQDAARAQSEEPGPSSAALEGPVLMAINVERTQQGLDTAHKLTVQLLKAHLKGKVIGGQEWKAGNKKREDLMYDYR